MINPNLNPRTSPVYVGAFEHTVLTVRHVLYSSLLFPARGTLFENRCQGQEKSDGFIYAFFGKSLHYHAGFCRKSAFKCWIRERKILIFFQKFGSDQRSSLTRKQGFCNHTLHMQPCNHTNVTLCNHTTLLLCNHTIRARPITPR